MSIKTIFIALLFVLSLGANERIVSLSPSITEIVYALEKGDKLVATSDYSLYPEEAKKLQIIGGYSNPNIEKILSFSPTLVVGQEHNGATMQKLQYFKIKTLMLNLKTIESIKKSIALIDKEIHGSSPRMTNDIDSKETHSNENHIRHSQLDWESTKLIKNIDNAIKDAPKNKKPHSVMIVYGLHEDLRNGIYIAGHDIFFDDIISTCGNTNAYTSDTTSQPVLNYENVIALNPEQIIILYSKATDSHVDVKKALQAWHSLPTNASKNKRISIVDESYTHIPSHRVALTISRLCREMNF
ncbi:helical backbone metal receptor [Candidatus Sulfurimonas baltica]|uniref:ABC transporter substrate-binding protein n=1 Tax=Candidatus Sulfurimonas baltica TaxID=2740404 RepID=A0A7S7RN95_9BACT|nr:helical backbone metal receptor [Candidatus Sulfurimonas baltica]QOY52200.1 ABC transporter substrate-binding protein [Candidatus Sulfurimonas baltica]